MKFVVAIKRFFGTREGKGVKDLAAEIRALSPKDTAELAPMLSEALGEPVEDRDFSK
jgi:hypothetical protein